MITGTELNGLLVFSRVPLSSTSGLRLITDSWFEYRSISDMPSPATCPNTVWPIEPSRYWELSMRFKKNRFDARLPCTEESWYIDSVPFTFDRSGVLLNSFATVGFAVAVLLSRSTFAAG